MEFQIISPSDAEKQFRMNVTRLGYQQVLQAVSDISYNRENISQDLLAGANDLLLKLKSKKDEMKRPYLDVNNKIDEAFNSLFNPLSNLVQQKAEERKRIISEINAENAAIAAEKARKDGLQAKINGYLQKWANIASSATTKGTLDNLEAQINLAMGRPLEFKDMHEAFIQHCNAIKVVIQAKKKKLLNWTTFCLKNRRLFPKITSPNTKKHSKKRVKSIRKYVKSKKKPFR